jgi:Rrf2 family transcriptional regulator, iron-sulfur cluster assembly transcription factor
MNFSTTRRGEYGLTAMLYLSRPQAGDLAQIHEIAEHCGLPEPFLGQILRLLVRGGLVQSKKGVGGGFTLARKPDEISFLEVLEALEGPVAVNRCQSAVEHCHREGRCSMESVWSRAQEALIKVLRETSLADAYCVGHFPFVADASIGTVKSAVAAGGNAKG